MQHVRVIADGTPSGTRVYNYDGELIPGVLSAVIRLDPYSVPTIVLEIASPQLDINGLPVSLDELEASLKIAPPIDSNTNKEEESK